jgi:two-component system OmpR family sensor kinase
LNKNEKKALYSFLFIYIGSTVLILSILLLSYYQKETDMLDRQCSIEMISAANKIKADILNAEMENKTFIPKELKNKNLKYGLFDKDGNTIYSKLENNNIDLNDEASHNSTHSFHVSQLEKQHHEKIKIKYIVIETNQAISEIKKTKDLYYIDSFIKYYFYWFYWLFTCKAIIKTSKRKS